MRFARRVLRRVEPDGKRAAGASGDLPRSLRVRPSVKRACDAVTQGLSPAALQAAMIETADLPLCCNVDCSWRGAGDVAERRTGDCADHFADAFAQPSRIYPQASF